MKRAKEQELVFSLQISCLIMPVLHELFVLVTLCTYS